MSHIVIVEIPENGAAFSKITSDLPSPAIELLISIDPDTAEVIIRDIFTPAKPPDVSKVGR